MGRYFFSESTRNVLTFVNTTAIAYGQKPAAPVGFLPICSSSCVHKRQSKASSGGLRLGE